MSKLLLMSCIIALMTIPVFAARDSSPKRGLKKALTRMAMYYGFYAFALMFLWGRC